MFHGTAYGKRFVADVLRRVGPGGTGYFYARYQDGVVVINYLRRAHNQGW